MRAVGTTQSARVTHLSGRARLVAAARPSARPQVGSRDIRLQEIRVAASPSSTDPQKDQPVQQEQDAEFEGLLPEEDYEVPGTYMDAMSSQTKLGKAVKAAVEELEHLGNLEAEVLQECDDLLKQLGMKGSLFGSGDNPLLRLRQELQQQQELEEQQQKQQKEQKEQQQ